MEGCFTVFFAMIFALALSWAITCGLIYLITLCFALEFSWLTATGVWLLLSLISSFFRSTTSKK